MKHLTLLQFWATNYVTRDLRDATASQAGLSLYLIPTWKPNLCWCLTAWQGWCAYVGKFWTIIKVICWSCVYSKWIRCYLGWGRWPDEPEMPLMHLLHLAFFALNTHKRNRSTKTLFLSEVTLYATHTPPQLTSITLCSILDANCSPCWEVNVVPVPLNIVF